MINLHICYSLYYDTIKRVHPPSFSLNMVLDTVEIAQEILEKYKSEYSVKAYAIIHSDGSIGEVWCS